MGTRIDDSDAKGDANGAQEQPEAVEDQELLDSAFTDLGREFAWRRPPVFAVIPEEIIKAPPEEFSAFLESIFADDSDLEEAVERFLRPYAEHSDGDDSIKSRSVRAVVPSQLLGAARTDPAEFLDQVYEAFDELDQALAVLHDRRLRRADAAADSATAVVSDRLIANPEELAAAMDRARDEAERLELLIRQARHSLRRLDMYRLSKKSPGQVIDDMRRGGELRTLQYLVEFLRSIHTAAESFEKLELPKVHIRDYLTHLYLMKDWKAMRTLVDQLRASVLKYVRSGIRGEEE